jgi:hypothetical protein
VEYSASLLWQLSGLESRHLSKIQNGRRKQRSGQHNLAHPKNTKKLCILSEQIEERKCTVLYGTATWPVGARTLKGSLPNLTKIIRAWYLILIPGPKSKTDPSGSIHSIIFHYPTQGSLENFYSVAHQTIEIKANPSICYEKLGFDEAKQCRSKYAAFFILCCWGQLATVSASFLNFCLS